MKKNILIIVLAFLLVGLLGFITYDNFFVKTIDNKCSTKTVKEAKKEEKKEEKKETRYYQFINYIDEVRDESVINYTATEIELKDDGTAKFAYGGASSGGNFEGIYIENDKYVTLFVNNTNAACANGSHEVANSCTEELLLIKNKGLLIENSDSVYHFSIDNSVETREFKKIDSSDLKIIKE